jgi:hypothetical protein
MRGIETNFITIVSEACNKNFTGSQLTSILAAGPSNAGLSGSDYERKIRKILNIMRGPLWASYGSLSM